MKTLRKRAAVALASAILALGAASGVWAQEHTGGPGGSGGGHETGGETGGHTGGAGGHGGAGMGGSHTPGAEAGGEEAKGHGTRYQHRGHAGGQHSGASAHQAGGEHFGGGSGLRGNAQVPEGIGRYGAGFSALSVSDQGRFRYWGGWSLPEEPVTISTTSIATSSEMIPGPGGGPAVNVRSTLEAASRCEGVVSDMAATQQFGGNNLLRLNAARGMVDPALAASGRIASPYLMGNLQSELMKPKPNAVLAGTYLGLVAKVPVSAETVKRVGASLCASVGDDQAKAIAQVAEQQRAALMATARANGGSGHGTAR